LAIDGNANHNIATKVVSEADYIVKLIDISRKNCDSEEEAEALVMSPAALLVKRVRDNVTVDWTFRQDAQARLRVEVKRLLREYGYPPDEQKIATELVLEQASLFGDEWS